MATPVNPDRAEWQSVWLGREDTPEADGWYPVEGEVRTTRLATFERKVTIGDATRDSDDFISSWVVGDFSGGGQILDINEGSDTDRFWWGVAETRFQNQTSLPPEVVKFTLPGTAGSGMALPVGDVPITSTGNTVFYVYYNGKIHAMATASAFSSTLNLAVNAPSGPAVSFQGPTSSSGTTQDTPVLVVPSSAGSYYLFLTNSISVPTEINCTLNDVNAYLANGSQLPLISIVQFNSILYGMDSNGYLFTSANARQWKQVRLASGAYLRVPRGQGYRGLTVHMVGIEPKLFAITDEQLWLYGLSGSDPEWVDTPVHYPAAQTNGLAWARWRLGEDLWIGVGPDVMRLTTSSVIVPNNGPIRDDGLPPDMYKAGTSNTWQATSVIAMTGDHNFLYVLLYHNNGSNYPDFSLMSWTGTGWHCLWQGGVGSFTSSAPVGQQAWMALSRGHRSDQTTDYWLFIPTKEQAIYGMKLRTTFHNVKAGARAGIDRFAKTTTKPGSVATTTLPWIETGRFDANMVGFKKLASHLQVGLEFADATNGIRLYYQTDADQQANNGTTSADYPTEWHPIPEDGSLINTLGLSTIVLPGYTTKFDNGIPFQWIRFKVEFDGDGGTKTPILNHLVLSYTKVPQDAASFVLTIPLPRETWLGRTGREMADDLQELLVTQEYLKLVHQNKTYRVRVAGISGAESTGDDYAGARTVNLIEIMG